ncbi:MAG: hypothetical protein HN348_12515 [Proteobacteria bacterium]|nr:hypothetical protein [Pseudomonadota bacterium]
MSGITHLNGLFIEGNESLCQSVIDSFIAGIVSTEEVRSYNNDDSC